MLSRRLKHIERRRNTFALKDKSGRSSHSAEYILKTRGSWLY